ncbi:MAG: response regulator [Nitrospirae bacterium]|nr:response regulator [Candidatus Troglogloeales bacterium]
MNKKILVVDDSAIMRSLVVSALEEINGVETVEAGNGYEALKVLPQHPFDMIITDINMPEINGLEIVHFVKSNEAYKKIPTVIISTDHGEAEVKKGLSLGANRYFIKPFEMERLKDAVREFLDIAE